jgi:hypothetical protein
MKIAGLILTLATLALIVIGMMPDQSALLPAAAVTAGLAFLVQIVNRPKTALPPAIAGPAKANQVSATSVDAPRRAEAEVLSFLATLQEKGRLVDFLMDDVTAFDDAQVGAAARVVHEGCRAALNECITIVPVSESAEGSTVAIPAAHRADEYRLTGKLSGEGPFSGTVVHRGWKSAACKLPQVIVPDGELPCIAPAEVEVKGEARSR